MSSEPCRSPSLESDESFDILSESLMHIEEHQDLMGSSIGVEDRQSIHEEHSWTELHLPRESDTSPQAAPLALHENQENPELKRSFANSYEAQSVTPMKQSIVLPNMLQVESGLDTSSDSISTTTSLPPDMNSVDIWGKLLQVKNENLRLTDIIMEKNKTIKDQCEKLVTWKENVQKAYQDEKQIIDDNERGTSSNSISTTTTLSSDMNSVEMDEKLLEVCNKIECLNDIIQQNDTTIKDQCEKSITLKENYYQKFYQDHKQIIDSNERLKNEVHRLKQDIHKLSEFKNFQYDEIVSLKNTLKEKEKLSNVLESSHVKMTKFELDVSNKKARELEWKMHCVMLENANLTKNLDELKSGTVKIEQYEKQIQVFQKALHDSKLQIEKLKKENHNLTQGSEELGNHKNLQDEEIASLRNMLKAKQKVIDEKLVKSSQDNMKSFELDISNKKVRELESAMRKVTLENAELKEYLNKLKSDTAKIEQYKKEIEMLQEELWASNLQIGESKMELLKIKSLDDDQQKSMTEVIECLRSRLQYMEQQLAAAPSPEEVDNILQQLLSTQATLTQVEQSKAAADAQVGTLNNELSELRTQLERTRHVADAQATALLENSSLWQKLAEIKEGEMHALQTQEVDHIRQQLVDTQATLTQVEQSKAAADAQVGTLNNELSELRMQLGDFRLAADAQATALLENSSLWQKLAETKEGEMRALHTQEVDHIRQQLVDTQATLKQVEHREAAANSQVETLNNKLAELRTQLDAEVTALNKELLEARKLAETRRGDVRRLQEALEVYKKDFETKRNANNILRAENEKLSDDIKNLRIQEEIDFTKKDYFVNPLQTETQKSPSASSGSSTPAFSRRSKKCPKCNSGLTWESGFPFCERIGCNNNVFIPAMYRNPF